MSDSKENEERGQSMPMDVEESHQLVDAEVQIEPEAPTSKDALNHVETGKEEPLAEDENVKAGKAEPPAEDENVKAGKAEPLAEDENVKTGKSDLLVEDEILKTGKAKPIVEEDIVKPGEAESIAEDENVNPGNTEPPVKDNSKKPVKAQAPTDDKSVNPGKVEPSAEDDSEQPVKVELPVEDKSLNAEKEELPVEENSLKQGKLEVPAEDNRVEEAVLGNICQQDVQNTLQSAPVEFDTQISNKVECEKSSNAKTKADEFPQCNMDVKNDDSSRRNNVAAAETMMEVKPEARELVNSKTCDNVDIIASHNEPTTPQSVPTYTKAEIKNDLQVANKGDEEQAVEPEDNGNSNSTQISFLNADHCYDGNESGTDEEQSNFMKELENFFRERSMEFKPPKFYGEGLNCLKLWRAVIRLGGYDKVTSCKLWRQVGESFKPPKTCTTVSWTFRGFYEKALLDYERHKIQVGELNVPIAATSLPEPVIIENQASASGRARRDAAARAMQGWHSRLLGNGEDRNSGSTQKREKQLKSINLLKRKKPSYMENAVKAVRSKPSKPQLDTTVVDVGPSADWVKINVQKTKDCFEVYALVPGLLREEVRVQSDPAGRLVISGEPENPNNPWGVTPFKKVVSLPSRIDPHQTSAVVTLHGQLFVRVPFEQAE
ncbi:hypothetical protein TanjilG_27720 [Lupinus angustifolius]|uniref:ARID domain-containing protein n=1 Tax=Lupinus angustifolius TaxID=3871 RepID=A0A4P1RH10_LUPAN|nr:hypothetical protein TanjilG_27720 [Lupinus angustifolius]